MSETEKQNDNNRRFMLKWFCKRESNKNYTVSQTISLAFAEIADRTAYDALINHYLDENTVLCPQHHKQNGHVIQKAIYNKYVFF